MAMPDVNPAAKLSIAHPVTPVVRREHAEGEIARLIEQQSGKLPSHFFLFAAFGAMALSLALEASGRERAGRFVAHWPTPLLILGMYNKLIKTLGTR